MESQKDKTYFSAFLFLGIFYEMKLKFTIWYILLFIWNIPQASIM